jgi:hypothetical protein
MHYCRLGEAKHSNGLKCSCRFLQTMLWSFSWQLQDNPEISTWLVIVLLDVDSSMVDCYSQVGPEPFGLHITEKSVMGRENQVHFTKQRCRSCRSRHVQMHLMRAKKQRESDSRRGTSNGLWKKWSNFRTPHREAGFCRRIVNTYQQTRFRRPILSLFVMLWTSECLRAHVTDLGFCWLDCLSLRRFQKCRDDTLMWYLFCWFLKCLLSWYSVNWTSSRNGALAVQIFSRSLRHFIYQFKFPHEIGIHMTDSDISMTI